MELWKTESRRNIVHMPPFLDVELHHVTLPSGKQIDDWTWVITPDYINVVAETREGKFIVFRQTKYAADGITLAPVGGYLNAGEDALTAAQRELREEAGYQADEWVALGKYAVDGNRGCGNANLFYARGAHFVGKSVSDDFEEQEMLLLTRDQLNTALINGEFKILAWAANVALALLYGNRIAPR
jgi:ADP-ribose pyrophosphatase